MSSPREPAAQPPPLPNTFWVLPGRLLAGEHPSAAQPEGTRERIASLLGAGIDCFLDLTAGDELPGYHALLPAYVRYHHRPLRDHDVPEHPEHMLEALQIIDAALRSGRTLYVHCRAGIGRTNTVLGCLLVERGLSGEQALEALNARWRQCSRSHTWPSVPETPSQVDYVRLWRRSLAAPQAGGTSAANGSPAALRARFRGALVGLAIGDALANPTQGRARGSYAPVSALEASAVLGLPRGAWSDDTAMALCLAESLVSCGGFDPRDQIERYTRWQQQGHLSATGQCVGITDGTGRALAAAQWRRQVFPGTHDPKRLDPEPLPRITPAVLHAFASPEEALRFASDAARITCQAPLVLETCRLFALMLHAALSGRPKAEVLTPAIAPETLRPRLRALLQGRYAAKPLQQIRSQGSILAVLEAALWAFQRSRDFREGALLAINLGEASDVVGAAYGALAGAHYGVAGIPPEWRASLARLELIEGLADQLLAQAMAGSQGRASA